MESYKCTNKTCTSADLNVGLNINEKEDNIESCFLFKDDCKTVDDCDFCKGLADLSSEKYGHERYESINDNYQTSSPLKSLSFIDKLLGLFVLLSMIIGVIIGVYAENGVRKSFKESAQWEGVSVPILIGLLVMIWPALAKAEWERLPDLFKDITLWIHIAISFVINWILAPLLMTALAWATLPDDTMERYRKGVILVGIARCIAMVMIWNTIARGDSLYCPVLVVFNSLLQVVLFSPYSLLFVNIFGGGQDGPQIQLDYEHTARSVGIYLGIPLAAGLITRFALLKFTTNNKFRSMFYNVTGNIGLLGLLYTITVLFANQGKAIVDNIGKVFRTIVPLICYFIIVWFITFAGFQKINCTDRFSRIAGGYERAVTQAFTAASNNFELAIAVATASFGPDAPEVLAATLGPLIEVPVLLALSYFALYLRSKLKWNGNTSLA